MGHLPTTNKIKASGTVEIILALSLFMFFGTFLIGALVYSLSTTKIPNTQKSAIEYASEGVEIVRYIRKDALSNIPNGTYGLSSTASEWTLSGTAEVISPLYTRVITITSPNANERLVTSTVNWSEGGRTGSESAMTILSNWQDAISVPTEWVTPVFYAYKTIPATTYDATYLKIFNGVLYATLRNGTTSSYFTSFDISAFPTITQGTTVNISALDTRSAFRHDVTDGNYRFYYSSANNSLELTALNVNTRTRIGALNMNNNYDANGVYASGNIVYVTTSFQNANPEFNVIQNTGNTTFTSLGIMHYTSTLYDVVKYDNTYAYVTTANTAAELGVVDISNNAAPTMVTTVNLPTTVAGIFRLQVSGTYLIAYRTSGTVTGSGIYIYDCANPALPVLVGTYPYAFLVYDVDVDPTRKYLFVVSSNTAGEFAVIDFSSPSAPVLRGTYNSSVNSIFRSVAWDSVNDRVYIGTTDNTNEIYILNAL